MRKRLHSLATKPAARGGVTLDARDCPPVVARATSRPLPADGLSFLAVDYHAAANAVNILIAQAGASL